MKLRHTGSTDIEHIYTGGSLTVRIPRAAMPIAEPWLTARLAHDELTVVLPGTVRRTAISGTIS